MQGNTQGPRDGTEGFNPEPDETVGARDDENDVDTEEYPDAQEPEESEPHRLTRRLLLIGGALAGGALVGGGVGALVLLMRGDDAEDEVAGAQETASPTDATETPATATTSPTPTSAPRERLAYIEDAPGAFEERDWANGELIDWEHGLFAMDVRSGAVHGWRLVAVTEWPPLYRSLGPNYVFAYTEDWSYLFNRATAKSSRWDSRRLYLNGTSEDYLVAGEWEPWDGSVRSTGKHWTTDPDGGIVTSFTGPEETSFMGTSDQLFSTPSGPRLILFSGRGQRGGGSTAHVVDVTTGEMTELFRAPLEEQDGQLAGVSVYARTDETCRIVATYRRSGNFPELFESYVLTWTGQLVQRWSSFATELEDLSPLGSSVRVDWIGPPPTSQMNGCLPGWPAAALYDSSGRQVWRLRSASLAYRRIYPLPGDRRWLADGSGFIAALRTDAGGERIQNVCGQPVRCAIIGEDGRVREQLPVSPADPKAWPVPSPQNANHIAFSPTQLYRRDSKSWLGFNFAPTAPGTSVRPHPGHDPWGGQVDEMLAVIHPVGAAGQRFGLGQLISPVLETAPFERQPVVVRIAAPGSCAPMLAEPNLEAASLGCLADGKRVHPVPSSSASPDGAGDWLAHVGTPQGVETGWVSAKYLAWDLS